MNSTEWRRAVFPGHVILQPFVVESTNNQVVMSYPRPYVVSYSIFAFFMILVPTFCVVAVPFYFVQNEIARVLLGALGGALVSCLGLFVFLPLPFLPFMEMPKVICFDGHLTLDFGFRRTTHDRTIELSGCRIVIERIDDEHAPLEERVYVCVRAEKDSEIYLLECQYEPTYITDRWKECAKLVDIEYCGFDGIEVTLPDGKKVRSKTSFQNTSVASFTQKTLQRQLDGSLLISNSLGMWLFGLIFFLGPPATAVVAIISTVLDAQALTLEHLIAWIMSLPIIFCLSWAGLGLLLCRAGNPNLFVDNTQKQISSWHWGYNFKKVRKTYAFTDCYTVQVLSARSEIASRIWEVNVIVRQTGDRLSIFKFSDEENAKDLANTLSTMIEIPILNI